MQFSHYLPRNNYLAKSSITNNTHTFLATPDSRKILAKKNILYIMYHLSFYTVYPLIFIRGEDFST